MGNGYNLEMIRDFLDQLLWEVRVSHFDNTNEKPRNVELAEQSRSTTASIVARSCLG